jgi:hypothetical protein
MPFLVGPFRFILPMQAAAKSSEPGAKPDHSASDKIKRVFRTVHLKFDLPVKPELVWRLRGEFLALTSFEDWKAYHRRNQKWIFSPEWAEWAMLRELFKDLLTLKPSSWHERLKQAYKREVLTWIGTPSYRVRTNPFCEVDFRLKVEEPLKDGEPGRDGEPYLGMKVKDLKDAFLASVYLDHLSGRRWKRCARQDCPRIFEVQTRHKKKFCEESCAHLVAVRNCRKNKQKKDKEAKRMMKGKRGERNGDF